MSDTDVVGGDNNVGIGDTAIGIANEVNMGLAFVSIAGTGVNIELSLGAFSGTNVEYVNIAMSMLVNPYVITGIPLILTTFAIILYTKHIK
jgi:hypothetical protein